MQIALMKKTRAAAYVLFVLTVTLASACSSVGDFEESSSIPESLAFVAEASSNEQPLDPLVDSATGGTTVTSVASPESLSVVERTQLANRSTGRRSVAGYAKNGNGKGRGNGSGNGKGKGNGSGTDDGAPTVTTVPPAGGSGTSEPSASPTTPTSLPTTATPTTAPTSTAPTTSPPTTPTSTTAPTTTSSTPPPTVAQGSRVAQPSYRAPALPSALQARGTDRRVFVVDGASGSDAASGSQAEPWKTIKAALARVEPGDTVLVRAGTYEVGKGGPVLTRSGRADAWITIAAWPGERPVVKPAEGSGFRVEGAHHIEVRGFEFIGPSAKDYGSGVNLANGAHHVRVIGNTMHGWAGSGISTTHSANVLIERNVVYGNSERSPYQTSGISMYQAVGADESGYDNVIRWNVVHGNRNVVPRPDGQLTDGNCVIIDDFRNEQGGSPHPVYRGSTLVAANSCFDNGGRGVLVYKANNVDVVSNSIIRNLLTASINGGELTAAQASNISFVGNLVVTRGDRPAVMVVQADSVRQNDNTFVAAVKPSLGSGDEWYSPDSVSAPAPITRVSSLPGLG